MSENLRHRLERYFSDEIMDILHEIGKKTSERGEEIFLVGGTIRDLLLDRANFDIDLVIDGDAIKLAQEISEKVQSRLIIHRRFSTAKLVFANFNLDIATARRETYHRPGALPEVEPGTIAEDLFRRDFSINAMAMSLAPGRFGDLIDMYRGREDIVGRSIRILHPDSFIDDATRIFRAIRYEQRLGFVIESQTCQLLQRDIDMISSISGDRLRNELVLILKEEFPEKVLDRAGQFKILNKLSPSLVGNGWLSEKFATARCFYKRTISYPLYLCLLMYRLTEDEIEHFFSWLNFPAKLIRSMRHTLQLKAKLNSLTNAELRLSDIYDLLHPFELQAIQANMIATDSSIIRQRIQLYLKKLRLIRPFLDGQYLVRMGVPEGFQIGEILNRLYRAKINGEVTTYRDEVKLVYTWLHNLN